MWLIWTFKCQHGCYVLHVYILQVQLSVEDIETILDTLIYDGKCERSIVAAAGDVGQTKLYRSVKPFIQSTGLMKMPCGSCPVSLNLFM